MNAHLAHDYVARSIYALSRVKAERRIADLQLKTLTSWNIAKKSVKKFQWSVWNHEDVNVIVRFGGEKYRFIYPKNSDFNLFLNPYFHEYEVTKFVTAALCEGDVFLDVGAHAGLYSVIAGKKVGLKGKVVSFEPNPFNVKYLKENIALNNISNVTVFPEALSSKSELLTFYFKRDLTGFTTVENKHFRNQEIVVCEASTLDMAVAPFNFDRVKVLKIDTEKCDLKVLQGALGVLSKTENVIVETSNKETKRFLEELGFDVSVFKPSTYLLARREL